MERSGCSVFKVPCRSVNASVSDAAADTLMAPEGFGAEGDAAELAVDVVVSSELQAAPTNASTMASTASTRDCPDTETSSASTARTVVRICGLRCYDSLQTRVIDAACR